MGRISQRRMAQINMNVDKEQSGGQAKRERREDRTKLYIAIGIAGIVTVLAIAFIVSNAFGRGSSLTTGQYARVQQQVQQPGQAGQESGSLGADVQVIRMAVTSRGYQPSQLAAQAGRPIRLIVDGSQAPGCYSYIMSQSLGFSQELGPQPAVIDLPPLQPGSYGFSCGMGMIRGSLNVR